MIVEIELVSISTIDRHDRHQTENWYQNMFVRMVAAIFCDRDYHMETRLYDMSRRHVSFLCKTRPEDSSCKTEIETWEVQTMEGPCCYPAQLIDPFR